MLFHYNFYKVEDFLLTRSIILFKDGKDKDKKDKDTKDKDKKKGVNSF